MKQRLADLEGLGPGVAQDRAQHDDVINFAQGDGEKEKQRDVKFVVIARQTDSCGIDDRPLAKRTAAHKRIIPQPA